MRRIVHQLGILYRIGMESGPRAVFQAVFDKMSGRTIREMAVSLPAGHSEKTIIELAGVVTLTGRDRETF